MVTKTEQPPIPEGFEEQELLTPAQLGVILGRGTASIRIDHSKRPHTLPPSFVIPGRRVLAWRRKDVLEWMEALADLEKDKREEQRKFAERFPERALRGPAPSHSRRSHIKLGKDTTGARASARLLRKRAEREAAES